MNTHRSCALLATVFCVAASSAVAQTSPPSTGRAMQHSQAGIDYLSGGVGDENRTAMAARQGEFPFKIVLSTGSGEYVVVDELTISTQQHELLTVRGAGPFVMLKLPAGQYKLEASWKGKTEQQTAHVTGAAQTLSWHLAG